MISAAAASGYSVSAEIAKPTEPLRGYEYVLNGEMTAAEYCAQVQPAMQAALDNANEMKAAASGE